MRIENRGLILEYLDETWGSCRHWQVIESVREVKDEEEAEEIIRKKERDGFISCFDCEELEKVYNDSGKNKHRTGKFLFRTEKGKMYLVKRWDKSHPSCNRSKWLSGFIYYLVKDGKVIKEWDKRISGW